MRIIPLVVGSLGVIPKQFGNRLKETGKQGKAILLGTARTLRKGSQTPRLVVAD